jgi:hypothetical protein
MHVGTTTYISWCPGDKNRIQMLGVSVPIYSPHIENRTFEDDQKPEGEGGSPRPPEHTVAINGLDETRILTWWQTFKHPGNAWWLGRNCSTTVGRALMMGGGDDYARGFTGWWRSWHTIWWPEAALRYAQAIETGLLSAGSRWFAINFIRRFTTSPLAMTSLTWSMDESGLARALFNEYGSDAARVEEVFRELDEHRNYESDAVAEAYVNLLMQRGGSPLEAVRRSQSLKERLLKVLREGWTTAGEQQCIDFLKKLN